MPYSMRDPKQRVSKKQQAGLIAQTGTLSRQLSELRSATASSEFPLTGDIHVKHLTSIAVAGVLAASVLPAAAADITGAGSTFVYPVLAKWADAYKKDTGIGLNYQSIGSGGGIKQITAKTVTFGASDMPLNPEDVAKNNFVQFPIINGAVVPLINLPGIKPGEVTLDGPTIAKIYPR